MNTIAERIKSRLDRSKGLTQANLARFCGVSTGAISQWMGGGGIDIKNIVKIAQFLEVSPKWLQTGEGEVKTYCANEETPPPGVVAIPEYELRFSAGGNGANEPEWEVVNNSRPVWYEIDELRQFGVNPERCKRARVTGDSMEPTLSAGDVVLWAQEIDPRVGCVHILDGCIYVLSIEGTCKIKRLSRIKNGLSVMSDNSRYPTEIYSGDECESIRIFGRVLEVKRKF